MSYTQYEQRVSDPIGDEHLVEVTESRHWFSPGRVIGLCLGLFLAFVGTVALMKTGVSDNLTTPQTTVFGMAQSAAIAIGELSAGLLIVVFAMWEDSRPIMAVLGLFAVIIGVMGAVASPQLQHDVGFATNTAWFIVFCGVVAIVASVLPAVLESRRDVREIDDSGRTRLV